MLSHNLLGTRGYWAPEQQNYPPDYKWNFKQIVPNRNNGYGNVYSRIEKEF